MDRRELVSAAWANRPRGYDTWADRKRFRETKDLAIGDSVTWKKIDLLGDYEDMTLMDGHHNVTGCRILGFTPQDFVQIQVPYGVLERGKTKTRVSPRYLTKEETKKQR